MDQRWRVDPYTLHGRTCRGKVHVVADGYSLAQVDRREGKTRCGKLIIEMPGSLTEAEADCKACLRSIRAEADRVARQAERERERERWERERERAQAEWWAKYTTYLSTPRWHAKRAAVLRRAGGICEACGVAEATQAHHLTYEHVGDEPLFDLRAVCVRCHDKITEMDRQRRSGAVQDWLPELRVSA